MFLKSSRLRVFTKCRLNDINPFLANVPILYPLKTPENLWFSLFLGGIKWERWPEMG